mmetsp:Transcript_33569/g.85024  ORF Transcript_33569/g.85024 Transcript_33569/m.85024 type:complete len:215 (-) Transcript_33569:945-1589(-)
MPVVGHKHALLAVGLPGLALVPVTANGQDERRLHRGHAQQRKAEQVVRVRAVRIAVRVARAVVRDVVHKHIVHALLVHVPEGDVVRAAQAQVQALVHAQVLGAGVTRLGGGRQVARGDHHDAVPRRGQRLGQCAHHVTQPACLAEGRDLRRHKHNIHGLRLGLGGRCAGGCRLHGCCALLGRRRCAAASWRCWCCLGGRWHRSRSWCLGAGRWC